jgi:hypothetical protein
MHTRDVAMLEAAIRSRAIDCRGEMGLGARMFGTSCRDGRLGVDVQGTGGLGERNVTGEMRALELRGRELEMGLEG